MNSMTHFQDRLDAVSRAVLKGDFTASLRCLDLPHPFSTLEADFVLRDAWKAEEDAGWRADIWLERGPARPEARP
ncbi:hypothetical protein [Neotabrizicola sp. sgz301269]|uniref:hypothetical protein n=1 Tax=Neotabrizicola sp. sgz301269 TaxID=3276282 RepID=UPI0037704CB6